MTTNADPDIINEAKLYAREAIHEAWPAAVEAAEPTARMFERVAISQPSSIQKHTQWLSGRLASCTTR